MIDACDHRKAIMKGTAKTTGAVVDIIIMGDFNRHDQLWGGDERCPSEDRARPDH